MDWRNRLGLYGAYFCAMAGIGFTLPYLPLYLKERGLSDRDIGLLSTLAALGALVQFLVGIWSDRIGRHKPFLVVSLGVLAAATVALPRVSGGPWLAMAVILFAENGVCRAIVESQAGAEAVALADPSQVGRRWGACDSGSRSASSRSCWSAAGSPSGRASRRSWPRWRSFRDWRSSRPS